MKIKEGYILSEVAGTPVAIPVTGEAGSFGGMMRMNGTGRFLWEALSEETTEEAVVGKLLSEYEVGEDIARRDVAAFVQKLRENGMLAE